MRWDLLATVHSKLLELLAVLKLVPEVVPQLEFPLMAQVVMPVTVLLVVHSP